MDCGEANLDDDEEDLPAHELHEERGPIVHVAEGRLPELLEETAQGEDAEGEPLDPAQMPPEENLPNKEFTFLYFSSCNSFFLFSFVSINSKIEENEKLQNSQICWNVLSMEDETEKIRNNNLESDPNDDDPKLKQQRVRGRVEVGQVDEGQVVVQAVQPSRNDILEEHWKINETKNEKKLQSISQLPKTAFSMFSCFPSPRKKDKKLHSISKLPRTAFNH